MVPERLGGGDKKKKKTNLSRSKWLLSHLVTSPQYFCENMNYHCHSCVPTQCHSCSNSDL